ncbi:hypothetical protein BGX31_008610 [Mortierella sp. GBA43]|nr:hypothetical protein BGX31_008610 [Mortierella sp. GBA43]
MSSDVVIASIQSIGRESPRPSKSRLLHYNPELFKCIIVDEAHHATSDTYTRVFQYFGVHKAESQLLVVGFTATAWRHDGIRLDAVFKDIVYHKSFLSMVQEEWLCNLRIERVTTGLDLWDVKITKDFESRQLAKKINTDKRNASVVKAYEDHCGNRRATIVFAADVKHAKTLTKEFEDRGHVAYCISSQIPPNERAGLVQRFRDGEIPILVNCEMLTEGVVDAIIMARPTYSTVLMVQMLGRGVRLYPEKTDCLVLDMTDTVNGEVLHTLPTLLGQDPKATSFAITKKGAAEILRRGNVLHTDQWLAPIDDQYKPPAQPAQGLIIDQDDIESKCNLHQGVPPIGASDIPVKEANGSSSTSWVAHTVTSLPNNEGGVAEHLPAVYKDGDDGDSSRAFLETITTSKGIEDLGDVLIAVNPHSGSGTTNINLQNLTDIENACGEKGFEGTPNLLHTELTTMDDSQGDSRKSQDIFQKDPYKEASLIGNQGVDDGGSNSKGIVKAVLDGIKKTLGWIWEEGHSNAENLEGPPDGNKATTSMDSQAPKDNVPLDFVHVLVSEAEARKLRENGYTVIEIGRVKLGRR